MNAKNNLTFHLVNSPKKHILTLFSLCVCLLISSISLNAQTKKINRPKSTVGITSVDSFVGESFNFYDKVYKYDAYAAAGTPLEDEDLDILEDALNNITNLSESAPDIISDLEGLSVLKQTKATLQINRAKKALKYSLKTAKALLLGKNKEEEEEEEEENTSTSDTKIADESSEEPTSTTKKLNTSDTIEVYSKFDFVPGDKLLFFDDFSQDFIGDFPSKWNTNASGEVVKISNVEGNWFEFKPGYNIFFIPDVKDLPEDYTIEFDLLTQGLGKQTSSTARLFVTLSDNDKFNNGAEHYVTASIPFGQYGAFAFRVNNYFDRNSGAINTTIAADIRTEVLNQPHISISVTKNRYRLWVNEVKYVDIPRFIEKLDVLKYLKFNINNFKDGEERLFIRDIKVAEGGLDLRRELANKGKVSTNGILFNSGSLEILPQSYGIIRQISQVLQQDSTLNLKIVGHTDADGKEDANISLSKNRADAVKQALISVYKIAENRLQTDGKGEENPVADNNTANGKAQNRRVEFIKI